jgi:hypothetical protein
VAQLDSKPGFIRTRIHKMWIVRLGLRRPYSFTVMAILIVLVGVVTITRSEIGGRIKTRGPRLLNPIRQG